MVYAINIILIWLLQNLLYLTVAERKGAFEMARFTIFLYVQPWLHTAFVADAAPLDLRTFKLLDVYEK